MVVLSTISPEINPTSSVVATQTPTSLMGRWICWSDGSPDPCHRKLNAISMYSDEMGWMVGEAGAILRWDGKQWTTIKSPVNVYLNYIKALTPNDAWAVGFSIINSNTLEREYILLRWNGREWSVFDNPTPFRYVLDMSFVDSDDGWAILSDDVSNGYNYLVHWDGKAWTIIRGTLDRYYAIEMLSKDDGWLTGTTSYRWNGQVWKEYSEPSLKGSSLSFSSVNDGWAVGSNELMYHWSGSNWQEFAVRNFFPTQVEMINSTNGWLVGGEQVSSGCEGGLRLKLLRWNGQRWISPVSNLPNWCYGHHDVQIAVSPNGQAWAVTTSPNQVWHWDGQAWKLYYDQKLPHTVTAFKFISLNKAWAVGGTLNEDGLTTGYIGYWGGMSWDEVKSPAVSTLNDVTFLSSNDGWAVGEGSQILHWDGEQWTESFRYIPTSSGWSADSYNLNAVSFSDPNNGWAVGEVNTEGGGSHYMLHWDGESWNRLDSDVLSELCGCPLFSIELLNQNFGWAVGRDGASLLWNGEKWQVTKNPSIKFINEWHSSVSVFSPSNAWRVGSNGVVLHWDGKEWKEAENAPTASMFTILALSDNEIWMAGKKIYHWDGISWQEVMNPVGSTEQVIVDLKVDPSGKIWAITDQGVLLSFEKNTP